MERKNYYKPVRVCKFWSNIYIETKVIEIKEVSVEEYLNKIRPYLKDIINILKTIHQKNMIGKHFRKII